MKRLGLLSCTLSLLALAACASPSNEVETAAAAAEPAPTVASIEALPTVAVAGPEDALVLPIRYSCNDERSFIATFPEHGNSVLIAAEGETRVLEHKGVDGGMVFADAGGATLSAEGAEATLTGVGYGVFSDCMAG